ncbi:glycoside hydrolase family 97 protein [Lutimonas zeaxanthinifaciens]|uniref:glycoside hydrolase family 97 protein n=1 Tax=Lutimonas zeaxanthinifaciens TaxID=3060215 RepID=UPI00265C92BD|nr:glycoside hydrolase family 97 protein [Lutimonas sp. YSD2104]WKK67191.1 glycoside hydrolase family 97 protein [Lutimonas sp. YSD2104]
MLFNFNIRFYLCFLFLVFVTPWIFGQIESISSPNGKLVLTVETEGELHWNVSLNGKPVIEDVAIAMLMGNDRVLGQNARLKNTDLDQKSESIRPVIPLKDAKIQSVYKELKLNYKDGYKILFRLFNDGLAYKFIDLKSNSEIVENEILQLRFPDGARSYFPEEESMYSHNERLYLYKEISEINNGEFCSLPVMFENLETKVLITEAALHNYPGMFLKKEGTGLQSSFPKFVLKASANELNSPDRNQIIENEADYIAEVDGARQYPWRVFIIGDEDRVFLESNLVTQLSNSSKIEDASWIKPGKVAWDWYNANNIYGVDFEAGINDQTYKYYIDFASENHIEYVILDEGWTKSTTEIKEANPEIDIEELIQYAKDKNVGIILWVLWKPLDEETEEILALYASWGAKGVKVDFMQRSDQYMVNSYERIAEIAAKYKLLVDYHGAFKPAGIEKVWPNLINYEGVKGNENNKWSHDITPEHNVTIPFIRMAAGPMDFTPGAMANAHERNYAVSFTRPMAMGTRCHQLAMYVIYEAPLQMLCETPSRYREEQESVDLISQIPTTWDETLVFDAEVADYILIGRRKGEDWYLAGMTDSTARSFELSLDFLPVDKNFKMEIFKDGVNASRHAEDYKREILDVDRNSVMPVNMVSGGGWIARIF